MDMRDTERDIGTQPGISRRTFMQRSTLVAGSLIVLSTLPGAADAAPAAAVDYAPQALTSAELATLKAVIDRLIPTDALGPGAVDSNVHAYIDRELTAYFKELLPLYQQSLAGIDAAAQHAHGMAFAALTAAQQDALLQQAEAGKLGSGWAGFFPVVLEHTREGMFGDPMYGGNTNYAGWDLIHYPGIKLVWSAGEQAIGTTVKPTHTSDATYGGHPFE
ncbi:MAG TPA: gluconate 2-dehydrogenase subunit 3 family protein [Chloroflexota bacterium]|jgi:gluconate 2-dehydrogenase gamma chain|nr:gluconate 2-dehydrogenase subunit 3 family protein [Chloroflexota bacterium]